MKRKYLLFLGIILLVSGIVCKPLVDARSWPLILIMVGGSLKLLYIALEIISKAYRPGKELLLLLLGLVVFFTGIYLKKNGVEYALFLMSVGIMMKLSFIFFFVKRKKGMAS